VPVSRNEPTLGLVRDELRDLSAVWRSGGTAGVGTVVRTYASAPRLPGASMVVGPDGAVSGSVSGGCVEGAVYELATEVTGTGVPVLQRYGVSDDDAFAVGLTGSRRTHDDRMERLREAGLTDAELNRLSSPIGLDLGARTPEETAVSIAAEIIAGRWGGSGRPLTDAAGRIQRHVGGQERSDTLIDGDQHSQLSDSLTRY
jgi:xanthine/CO dehydrogenase XdhC/CoxF family maturation factor